MTVVRKSLLLAFAAGFMVASPAAAAQDATEDEQAQEGNAVSEVVCRRMAAPTGTRIGPRRVCKTQHQWDLIEAESRDVIEDIGNRSRVGNEGGGG